MQAVNLADIVGIAEDREARRIVDFTPEPGGLRVTETCDEWFSIVLDAEQVDRLIDWLRRYRSSG